MIEGNMAKETSLSSISLSLRRITCASSPQRYVHIKGQIIPKSIDPISYKLFSIVFDYPNPNECFNNTTRKTMDHRTREHSAKRIKYDTRITREHRRTKLAIGETTRTSSPFSLGGANKTLLFIQQSLAQSHTSLKGQVVAMTTMTTKGWLTLFFPASNQMTSARICTGSTTPRSTKTTSIFRNFQVDPNPSQAQKGNQPFES